MLHGEIQNPTETPPCLIKRWASPTDFTIFNSSIALARFIILVRRGGVEPPSR